MDHQIRPASRLRRPVLIGCGRRPVLLGALGIVSLTLWAFWVPVSWTVASSGTSAAPAVSAAIVLLVRGTEKDTNEACQALASIENYFSRNYPILIFLDYARCSAYTLVEQARMARLRASAPALTMSFHRLPHNVSELPAWIAADDTLRPHIPWTSHKDEPKFYGYSYRGMCRWFAQPFANHSALRPYSYYMRLDSDARFVAPCPYDYIADAAHRGLRYVWSTLQRDSSLHLIGLWDTVMGFAQRNPRAVFGGDAMPGLKWLRGASGTYTREIYYTNLEIADLNWLRSEPYVRFFNHIDQAGGIYIHRWGDAPIRTLAVGLMLDPDKEVDKMHGLIYWHQGPHLDLVYLKLAIGVGVVAGVVLLLLVGLCLRRMIVSRRGIVK